jgi:hypothetical protein
VKTVHLKLKGFWCYICNKGLLSGNVRPHVAYVHISSDTINIGKQEVKNNFYFAQCQKKFASYQNLKSHIASIHDKKEKKDPAFACGYCSFLGRSAPHLRNHIGQVHNGEKAFRCTQCPYITTRRERLEAHVLKKHPKAEEHALKKHPETENHQLKKHPETEAAAGGQGTHVLTSPA